MGGAGFETDHCAGAQLPLAWEQSGLVLATARARTAPRPVEPYFHNDTSNRRSLQFVQQTVAKGHPRDFQQEFSADQFYGATATGNCWLRTIGIRLSAQPDPWMTTLDCADSSQSTPTRNETVTPLQALSLLNSPFTLVMAEHFAHTARDAADDLPAQTIHAVRRALQRSPTPAERGCGTRARQATRPASSSQAASPRVTCNSRQRSGDPSG